jgi:hypothetical protein
MRARNLLLVAAAALAASFVACSGGDNDTSSDDGGPGAATVAGTTNPESAPGGDPRALADASSGGAAAGAPERGDGDPLPSSAGFDRKIIFNATMSLEAGDVSRAFNEASALARSSGGYIERSSFANAAEEKERTASLTIRVPVQNYEGLLANLRAMAGVRILTEGSKSSEVTEQYTDLQSRLRNLENTEQQYLALLKEAKTIQEILTVQDRLSGVRSQIEQIQGRLKVLDSLTDFATVDLSIVPVAAKVESPSSGLKLTEVWTESWAISLEVARYVAAAGMVAVVALAWLALPLLVIALAARRFRRAAHVPPPPQTPEAAA